MPESLEHPQLPVEALEPNSSFENENREKINSLPDWEEPGLFYRGLTADDALKGIFGELKIDSNPKGSKMGSRDNISLNLHDAIYLGHNASETKDGRKFMCAIGFDPMPGAIIEPSFLGRDTFMRFTGSPKVTEIILRFAGRQPGQPGKIKYFSPKEFYLWYKENFE
ncbi:hypothetical protein KJ590_00710 [Patescibacteria group bacterium]|nr:hypothetical protein [Patescibacteria group bacterium]MBU4142509.1 hypothetical protein [Patescibacteria group bacterium]